jgi:hypothetical protein
MDKVEYSRLNLTGLSEGGANFMHGALFMHFCINSVMNDLFLMDALRPFAERLRHNAYYKRSEVTKPIFALFLTESDASYAIREVSEHSKVPISTLYSWREKVRTCPDWLPFPEYFSLNARAFLPHVETTLTHFIHSPFVSQGRALTRPTLRLLLLLPVQDLVAEGVLESQGLDFKRPYHFVSNFLKRVDLGFRRARARRWPIFDDEECTHFMANMITASHRYPHI